MRHADPQRRVVVGGPVAPRDRHRRQVVVVERARLDPRRGSRSSTRPSASSSWLAMLWSRHPWPSSRVYSPAGAWLGPRLMKRPAPFLPTNASALDDDRPVGDDHARRAFDLRAFVGVVVHPHVQASSRRASAPSRDRRRRCRRRCRRRWCPSAETARTSLPAWSSTARRSGSGDASWRTPPSWTSVSRVSMPGRAVRDLAEVVLAQLLLFGHAERAVVGRDHLQIVLRQPFPQHVLVPLLAQRRRHHVLGAVEARLLVVVVGQEEILRARLGVGGQAHVARLRTFSSASADERWTM